MAPVTRVDGKKVHIDDCTYVVSPAGKDHYGVADDFGGNLGYFTVRGKTISPDDFGVEGAHPILQIGKLWAAANLFHDAVKSAAPTTRGVCRIAVHERPAEADLEKARAYRAWMKKQPGCKASYFVHDPATGKALSISIWENRAQIASLQSSTPPGDAVALAASSVEVYPMVEEP
jgi:hypothetical protein